LGEAARDDEPLTPSGLLEVGGLPDEVNGFLFRLLDEAAGVDDDDLGVLDVGAHDAPRFRDAAHEPLGIHEVLRATETDNPDRLGHVLLSSPCKEESGSYRHSILWASLSTRPKRG